MGKQALSYFTIGMKVGSIPTEENLTIYSKLVCANTLITSNLISSHLPQNMGKNIYKAIYCSTIFNSKTGYKQNAHQRGLEE